jgi:hypothetical protein
LDALCFTAFAAFSEKVFKCHGFLLNRFSESASDSPITL